MSLLIKVCGMRDSENISEVGSLQPNLMGFIFYGKSPRNAEGILDTKALGKLSPQIKKVGVFVNEKAETIKRLALKYGFSHLQLHGQESPEFCESLNEFTLLKAFAINEDFNFNTLKPYVGVVDYFLFDTKTKDAVGGTGKRFNWALLENYQLEVPFLLAGGIQPGLEKEIKSFKHKQFAGIDLNSKFELSPGLKNTKELKEFINHFRND